MQDHSASELQTNHMYSGLFQTIFVQIRKTETIMNNLNPDWKLLYVSLSELCDNDFNMMLKVILRTSFFILQGHSQNFNMMLKVIVRIR